MCINEAIFIDKDPLYGNKDKVKSALVEYQAEEKKTGRREKRTGDRRKSAEETMLPCCCLLLQ